MPSRIDPDIDGLISGFAEAAHSAEFASGIARAIASLSARGLVQASRWAAELLASLPAEIGRKATSSTSQHVLTSPSLLVAKTFFDTRQYRRCAGNLSRASSDAIADHERALAKFLRQYALYLCLEKDVAIDAGPGTQASETSRADVHKLREELANDEDPHCMYLHATILDKLGLGMEDGAIKSLLVRSVASFPWNWAAWKQLAGLVNDIDDARSILSEVRSTAEDERTETDMEAQRGIEVMCVLFWGWACLESDAAEEARDVFTSTLSVLQTSLFVKGCLATSYYHLRLFDEAQEVFEEVFADDENCLEGVDTYSNILYVKEDKVRLSVLAHRCVRVDKYCVETCCVVGNYYSLRGQHEQAVSYFQRALKLNRNYLSAWTLMGHEFVEMKNTAAAVEAYRRAVDVSPKDFRAWYGLGQTYELLDMPLYRLYYYSKAASLRPKDARMWCAVGQALEELSRLEDAIRAYERANGCDDREGLALSRLAALHERMARESPGQRNKHTKMAAVYHQQNLERHDAEGVRAPEAAAALKFLAGYALDEGRLLDAEQFSMRLLDYPGLDKDYAKTLLHDIHTQRAQGT